MTEMQIHCVKQSNNVITHVGIGTTRYPIGMVVNWIRNKVNDIYTFKYGQKAMVYAKQSVNGNWFLTTEPDSTKENNLDFLPSCL
jgi:D-mannonate dehydratase